IDELIVGQIVDVGAEQPPAFLTAAADGGGLSIENPGLAAEQFAAMCKGFGDVELRFGAPPTGEATRQRVEAAVDTFLRAYGRAS
ncbi:MAG: TetR/AcrR family transcriptional regulator C-terminal domain-containing protein, partial [Sphingopyxis sp.]|nr:TetR/AcrR family transcriptional regulator C-terminal domain-containing protein [Sphingopyxis sp.]